MVSLFDRLEFETIDRPGIQIEIFGHDGLTDGKDNLICRAYDFMAGEYDLERGLKVRLVKRIPVAAGLAGGSADAAATIGACNRLFGLGLKREDLMRAGARIGSDVPFFFSGGQALVRGRGDLIKEVELPVDYHVLLVNPGFELATSDSYARLKRGLTMSKNPFNLAACSRAKELVRSLRLSDNDFEEVHLQSYPELGRIKDGLLRSGASLSRMTGSGPTIFGIFFQAPDKQVGESMDMGNWRSFTVVPVTRPSQD
jgi:4-diphosphocytidyl-2-C-methyl-D-erythritol kinase